MQDASTEVPLDAIMFTTGGLRSPMTPQMMCMISSEYTNTVNGLEEGQKRKFELFWHGICLCTVGVAHGVVLV